MKKNLSVLAAFAVVVALTFSSCGNKEAKTETETPATEQSAEGTSSSINSVDQAIDEYEKIVDEYVVAMKGSTTGDAEAMKKMQDLGPKFQEISQKFQNTANYTPEQIQRLQAIAQKITDSMQQK